MFGSLLGMLGSVSPRFYVIAFLVVLLTGMFGYGYVRYTSLVNTTHEQEMHIAQLDSEAKVAQKAIQDAETRLKVTIQDYEDIRAINDMLITKNRGYQKELDRLNGILNKKGRDIGAIANEKPKLIEKVVNKAAQDRKRCLEVISGKPKLKGEKNEVCPNLFID